MASSDEYMDGLSDGDWTPNAHSASTSSKKRHTQSTTPVTPTKKQRRTHAQPVTSEELVQAPMQRKISLYTLPAEIVDAILYDDELRVHDHIALARTCRALRAAHYTPPPNNDSYASFTSPIWAALIAQRPFEGQGRGSDLYSLSTHAPSEKKENRLRHLWSNRFDERKMTVLAVKKVAAQRTWSRAHQTYIETPQRHEKMPIRSIEWDEAIETVAKQRITKTTAKSQYKLSEADLGRLPYVERRNPHYRSAAPMQLYVEAKVERLAYRLHGGYRAHVQLLDKRAESAAKARSTRRAKLNGTWQPPTPQQSPTKRKKRDEIVATPGWRQLPSPSKRLATPESDAEDDSSSHAGPSTPTKPRMTKKVAMQLQPTPRSPGDLEAINKFSFANSTSPTPANGRVHHSVLFSAAPSSTNEIGGSPVSYTAQGSRDVKKEHLDVNQKPLFLSGLGDQIKLEDIKPFVSHSAPSFGNAITYAQQDDGGANSSAAGQAADLGGDIKQEFDEGGPATGRPRRQRAKRSYAMYA